MYPFTLVTTSSSASAVVAGGNIIQHLSSFHKKTNEKFFSQKMWWKRKCVKIRFVWKRWCIKAFDFSKTCCGIYILYDWTPARLKRMCDLLFSFDRFPGFHRCVLSDNYSFCLNSRRLIILHLHSLPSVHKCSRGKGTDGETIINLKHWNNIFH